MRLETRYQQMRDGYDALSARLMPGSKSDDDAPLSPERMAWARQEGLQPVYNPNADEVTWVPTPKPAYTMPNTQRLQGSMSPERLAEVYPAFATKAKEIDPLLQEIYQAALDGKVTQQRAQELVMQLALDTYKQAWQGKAEGASKTAANFSQSLDGASTTNRIAGGNDD
ncbi:hypothetical protein GZZ44_10480 [Klebsiella aerogenes]|uniref:hypothetical protein n=1 Tax=Klebsiella aerogenes TaxID=548 RepID=UPI00190EE6BE|nr:hypothetical protein [Klebsiella aerogenes]MBK0633373.1 hypothetical protein [Klebsiella aerogenes]